MRYESPGTIDTPAHKLADAAVLAQGLNTQHLEIVAMNIDGMVMALTRDGRVHEAAFWSKMRLKLADALVDIAGGQSARRERSIFHDLVRARLFDLRCAANNDDNLDGAKPDTVGNRNMRKQLSEAR